MTQEEFGSSVLIENKQIKKQLSEYPSSTAAATLEGKANRADSPAQSSSVGAAPSALDCGILVPREKAATDAFAPGGGRGPVLSRPALAPPSKPRSNLQCASLPRGRRGSGTGNVRGGRGVPMQTHQEQHSNLDCAILVPSGKSGLSHTTSVRGCLCSTAFAVQADLPDSCRRDGTRNSGGSTGFRRHARRFISSASSYAKVLHQCWATGPTTTDTQIQDAICPCTCVSLPSLLSSRSSRCTTPRGKGG